MNDLDLCLEVVVRSCQPLRHIFAIEYLGNFTDRGFFQRTMHNR